MRGRLKGLWALLAIALACLLLCGSAHAQPDDPGSENAEPVFVTMGVPRQGVGPGIATDEFGNPTTAPTASPTAAPETDQFGNPVAPTAAPTTDQFGNPVTPTGSPAASPAFTPVSNETLDQITQITKTCPAGFFYDEEVNQCRVCASRWGACDLCTSDGCFQCSFGTINNYLDPETKTCIPCSIYGPSCQFCNETACEVCQLGTYFNTSEGLCWDCPPARNCPAENTTCTNSSLSLCFAEGCDRGYFNDPRVFQSACRPCSQLSLGESCEDCRISSASGLPECTDCGQGNYFNFSLGVCQQCGEVYGCKPGSQVCSAATGGDNSLCLAGQCEKLFFNRLDQPFASCLRMSDNTLGQTKYSLHMKISLPLLLETNLLPNTFTTEAYITFEDQFNNFFFKTNRGNYPYSCFLIKIAPDPMRNNFLDLGITCSDPNQLNAIIQTLNTGILNATTANEYPMDFIQCYVVPVFGPLLPYGLYQRRQCFICDPIANCAVPGFCDGAPIRATCLACENGYYPVSGFPPFTDRCVKCPPQPGCPPEYTRCTGDGEDEQLCVLGECNVGWFQNTTTQTPVISPLRNEQWTTCYKCPLSPGCREGFEACDIGTATSIIPQGYCAKGKCQEWEGYYNNITSCGPPYSTCYYANVTLELCGTEEQFIEDDGYYWLPLNISAFFRTFQGAGQVLNGLQLSGYPWTQFFVLGTRVNETSGNVLVDLYFANTALYLPYILGLQLAVLNSAPSVLDLGIVCFSQGFNEWTGLTPTLQAPQVIFGIPDYEDRTVCAGCRDIPFCLGPSTCGKCPNATRCAFCESSFYLAPAIKPTWTDQCNLCPPALNCTLLGTVCDCPNAPLCRPGFCDVGFWNNPAPPPLDCAFQDIYYCWDKDCILAAAHQPGGDTSPIPDPITGAMPAPETYQNAWDPSLNWVYFYGLGFVAPFYYCPFWYDGGATPGECEVAVYTPDEYPGTTKKRKLADLTQLSQIQFSFFDSQFFPEQPDWNTTVDDYPGYQLSINGCDPACQSICSKNQIRYYQLNFRKRIKFYQPLFEKCRAPLEPKYASPCRRHTICNPLNEFIYQRGSPTSDTVCKSCWEANQFQCTLGHLGGSNTNDAFCLNFFWNGTSCLPCGLGTNSSVCPGPANANQASVFPSAAICPGYFWNAPPLFPLNGTCMPCAPAPNCMPGYSICETAALSLCAGQSTRDLNMCKTNYGGFLLPGISWGVQCRPVTCDEGRINEGACPQGTFLIPNNTCYSCGNGNPILPTGNSYNFQQECCSPLGPTERPITTTTTTQGPTTIPSVFSTITIINPIPAATIPGFIPPVFIQTFTFISFFGGQTFPPSVTVSTGTTQSVPFGPSTRAAGDEPSKMSSDDKGEKEEKSSKDKDDKKDNDKDEKDGDSKDKKEKKPALPEGLGMDMMAPIPAYMPTTRTDVIEKTAVPETKPTQSSSKGKGSDGDDKDKKGDEKEDRDGDTKEKDSKESQDKEGKDEEGGDEERRRRRAVDDGRWTVRETRTVLNRRADGVIEKTLIVTETVYTRPTPTNSH